MATVAELAGQQDDPLVEEVLAILFSDQPVQRSIRPNEMLGFKNSSIVSPKAMVRWDERWLCSIHTVAFFDCYYLFTSDVII